MSSTGQGIHLSAKRVTPLGLVLLIAVGCQTPVGVKQVDPQTVHRNLTANALTTGEPSAPTRQVLTRGGLRERWESDPEGTLETLRARLEILDDADLVFALAELSFLYAEHSDSRAYSLAAAVYAYAYLFPESGDSPQPFDPRLRLAADLYNRGLTSAVTGSPGLVAGHQTWPLPFGSLDLEIPSQEFDWANFRMARFTPAAELEIRGLQNRYRQAGIGAPFAVTFERRAPPATTALTIPPRVKLPVTLLVRIESPRASIQTGSFRGEGALYTPNEAREAVVAGRTVPLEFEESSSLAYSLSRRELWTFMLSGYISGDVGLAGASDGVYALAPHEPGLTPLVLVHGTASSPGTWGELINELINDAVFREQFELWLFLYHTGNPIAYSAAVLRDSLREAVADLDPEGVDPGLQNMIVAGHSQGGLLTRMLVTDSGDRFVRNLTDAPLEDLDLEDDTRALIERALIFEPLPFVRRVIFMSTPHRGSYLAGMRLGDLAARLVTLPLSIARAGAELVTIQESAKVEMRVSKIPTSVDNMRPNHPFLRSLSASPIAEGVGVHSIVAVKTEGPLTGANDGVVAYESAHLEEADSEVVVRSGHSVQNTPRAIAEVKRILRVHLDER